MKTIICKCKTEITNLYAHAICLTCKEAIYTNYELTQKINTLRRKAELINFEMVSLAGELFLRERRITIEKEQRMRSNPNFFLGVKKAPRGEKTTAANAKRDFNKEAKELLALVEGD
jgi:hypothetical protein